MVSEKDGERGPADKRTGERDGSDARGDEADDTTRINFTVPKRMKEQWQDMAKDMATSISQLIRNAVQAYGRDVEKDLKDAGSQIEQAGREFDRVVRNAGLDHPGDSDPARRVAEAFRVASAGPARAADPLDQLRKLKELLDMGAITEEEYKAKKAKLLDLV